MKVIIAGGRDYADYKTVCKVCDHMLQNQTDDLEIVSGACSSGKHTFTRADGTKVYGADGLGERYAAERNYAIKHFPADWNQFKRAAGFKRNVQMAEYADALIAFWDGKSPGTKNMIELATKRDFKIKVHNY